MAKHTPGPWTQKGHSVFIFNKSGHNRVAISVNTGCRCGCEEPALIEELEADARLIAAAPELLKALKGFEGLWLPTKDNDKKDEDIVQCQVSIGAIRKMKQAIAKTEGKE
jgi:hypothetical protein